MSSCFFPSPEDGFVCYDEGEVYILMLMLLFFFYNRVMGGSVAVAISGHGAQRFPVFLLSEIGYGMEACLSGANNSQPV